MTGESEFLLHAFWTGIYITFVYDLLRIFRRVLPHGDLLVSLEDILFWVYCADRVFLLMYYESNGTLRWFAIAGAIVGMLLYRRLVGTYLVKYASRLLRWVFGILGRVLAFLLRPFVRLYERIRDKIRRRAKQYAVKLLKKRENGVIFLKKQLTALKKMHRMYL